MTAFLQGTSLGQSCSRWGKDHPAAPMPAASPACRLMQKASTEHTSQNSHLGQHVAEWLNHPAWALSLNPHFPAGTGAPAAGRCCFPGEELAVLQQESGGAAGWGPSVSSTTCTQAPSLRSWHLSLPIVCTAGVAALAVTCSWAPQSHPGIAVTLGRILLCPRCLALGQEDKKVAFTGSILVAATRCDLEQGHREAMGGCPVMLPSGFAVPGHHP